jgi:hypothetical protein
MLNPKQFEDAGTFTSCAIAGSRGLQLLVNHMNDARLQLKAEAQRIDGGVGQLTGKALDGTAGVLAVKPGWWPPRLWLFFNGKQADNGNTLLNNRIGQDAVMHVVLRLQG